MKPNSLAQQSIPPELTDSHHHSQGPIITSIILLSTGRVVLTMWTLGVDVDLCLCEREPSEEGLEVLNVKAWGVEYLCWELGEERRQTIP